MKKLLCPQCKIAGMYVKNDQGERLLVYIAQDGTVVPQISGNPNRRIRFYGSILSGLFLAWIAQTTDKILSDTPPSCANKPKLHHRLTDYTEKHYYHLSLAI